MPADMRNEKWIETARRAMASARTPAQLRQCLAILIPALTGASLETTAQVLGVSRRSVRELRRGFPQGAAQLEKTGAQRGGRRHALMSADQERIFLQPWLEQEREGLGIDVAAFRSAYEQAVGRAVAKSTVYRLLTRHGWRRKNAVDMDQVRV